MLWLIKIILQLIVQRRTEGSEDLRRLNSTPADNHNNESVSGTIRNELRDIWDVQEKEVVELAKTNPELAKQKQIQNFQMRAQMLSNINKIYADTSGSIIKNIR